jgi:predicted Na+-dependent transporter
MLLILKAVVAATILAIGLNASADDLTYLWRQPALLAKSLVAMYVLAPAAAILIGYGFDLPWGTRVALLILAICAGAPLLPKRLVKLGGDPIYVFSLVVTTSLLSIVTVPLGVELLNKFVAFDGAATPGQVAMTILQAFLIPLGVGMIVRAAFPELAERMSGPLFKWTSLLLLVCAVVLLVASWRTLLEVGWPTLLAFAAFTLGALAAGHLLGGPEPAGRTSLAVASASRHIALALLVAGSYRGPRTLALVLGYVLTSALVSIPYVRWRAHVHAKTMLSSGSYAPL